MNERIEKQAVPQPRIVLAAGNGRERDDIEIALRRRIAGPREPYTITVCAPRVRSSATSTSLSSISIPSCASMLTPRA